MLDNLPNFVEGAQSLKNIACLHSARFEEVHKTALTADIQAVAQSVAVENDVEIAACRNLRVKIANCSRRRVTGIFEFVVGMGVVVLIQYRQSHYAFALQFAQTLERDSQRHRTNSLDLLGYVFAYDTVAPRGSADKLAVAIRYADGKTVVFDLYAEIRFAYLFVDFVHPFGKFAEALSLVETVQTLQMTVLLEILDRLSADSASRTVGQSYTRLPFHQNQLVVQRVIPSIRYGRIIQHVVLIRPFIELIDYFLHRHNDKTPN